MDKEHRRIVRQPDVDLEGHLADALPFVQAQDGRAIWGRQAGGEQGCAGEGRVSNRADIPLYPAAEPCVAQRQVCRLKDRVDGEQLTPTGFVQQRPEAPAVFEQEDGPQGIVFKHGGPKIALLPLTRVAVLQAVGQDVGQAAIVDVLTHIRRDGCIHAIHDVQIAIAGQRRKRIFRP